MNKCIYYVEGPCEQQLIAALKEAPGKLKIVFLPQVLNLEEELVRCTDVKKITELTKSGSVKNFKTDFCKMRTKDCRIMLDRHKLEYARLWMTRCPGVFDFVENNGAQVKTI